MCYWELIYETFLDLVGGDRELLRQIDGATVLHLQSRAPGISTQDLAVLEKRMQSGDLFREIDHEQRHGIWERLKRVDYPIPTLHTFFKDRLYLEVGQSVMRQLCTFSPETYVTIDECVMEQYDTYVPLSRHQRVEMLTPDLRELWRFSLQYGFEMTQHRRLVRRAQTQGSTPRPQTSLPTFDQPTFWQAFFQVAIQRGFRIPDHHELLGTPTALPSVAARDYPAEASEEIPVGQRYGKPLVDSAAADRFALSAESLDGPWDASRVSAVLLRRSFFHAFFRYLKSDSEGPLPREHAPHDPLANPHQEGAVEEPLTDTSNTAVFTHVANTPEPIPFYSLPDPPLTLQPDFLTSIPQPIFPMDFAIYNYTCSLDLPNELEILPRFFQELSQHHFHVTVPSENGRCLEKSQYYWYYTHNPGARLHAEFLYEDSFTIYGPERQVKRRKGSDGTDELYQAQRWLDTQVTRFTTPHDTPEAMDVASLHDQEEEL